MRHNQRGFISIPRGFFETVFALATLGLLAALAAAAYGVWWLVTHVTITF